MNKEKQLKKQLIKSAANIKKKVKIMKEIKNNSDKVLESIFKPITEPLNKISVITNKDDLATTCHKSSIQNESSSECGASSDESDCIPKKANIVSSPPSPSSEENDFSNNSFKSVPSEQSPFKDSSSWSLSSGVMGNVTFGLRSERGKLMMGNTRVFDGDNYINIGLYRYEKTPGLMQLLTQNTPDLKVINENDKQNYKHILMETNAHRRDFDPKKPLKSNKGMKYNYIIKPLFKLTKSDVTTSNESLVQGKGIAVLKKVKKNTDYVYWDDPNELVDRLKILIASRDAGNTGLDNEIISIIEELREASVIT